jgi:D-alanyl-D-alanine carboxypeptidase
MDGRKLSSRWWIASFEAIGPPGDSVRTVAFLTAVVMPVGAMFAHVGAQTTTSPPAASPRSADVTSALSTAQRRARLQRVLDAYHAQAPFPGGVLAAYLSDGTTIVVATGLADRDRQTAMTTDARMLAGSVGKMFFAALALQLVAEGRLKLDEPVATYLRGASWLPRLRNADRVTLRMLLNHTSGYSEQMSDCWDSLRVARRREPFRRFDHLEAIQCLFDTPPLFEPGARFQYSDVEYDLLATIEETVTHATAYGEIQRRLLDPLGLRHTGPSDRPRLPGLVPGYAGPHSPFGVPDAMMRDGALVETPAFDWGGGGIVSTASDLARWIAAWRNGQAFPSPLWPEVSRGVDASALAPGHTWGLGMGMEATSLGDVYEHGGIFPGYLTRVRWYEKLGIALAIQVNTSEYDKLPGWAPATVLDRAAVALTSPP